MPPVRGVRSPPASGWDWWAFSGAQASLRGTLIPGSRAPPASGWSWRAGRTTDRVADQAEVDEAATQRALRAFLPPPGVSPPETVAPAPATPTSLPQVAPESPAQIELEPDIGIGEAAYKMASADLMRRISPRIPAQPTPGNSPPVLTRSRRLVGLPVRGASRGVFSCVSCR